MAAERTSAGDEPLRVLVTGATGNIGTVLLRRLAAERRVAEVRGVVRRPPESGEEPYRSVVWHSLDVAREDVLAPLTEAMDGVDVVVHLAWAIQKGHDLQLMQATNVEGTRRVVGAAAAAGVRHLVFASSVGAYSPGPGDHPVDETWPTHGVPGSTYSRNKAEAERIVDEAARQHPGMTVSRVRPGLVMNRLAGAEMGRYFLGHVLPKAWVGRVPLPLVPLPRGMRGQVVHADDVADAVWRIIDRRAAGAYNLAADPPLTAADVAGVLRAPRHVPVPWRLTRAVVDATWRLRLHPADPGWIDLVHHVPIMSTERARTELGWEPTVPAQAALVELVQAIADGAGTTAPVLAPRGSRRRKAAHRSTQP